MTEEHKINVKVAECLGWREIAPSQVETAHLRGFPPNDNGRDWVPDFVNSRDAMAAALETLRPEEWPRFVEHLISDRAEEFGAGWSAKAALMSPPKQLAIAFLKAKGIEI